MDELAWQEQLANIDIDAALKMADLEAKQANAATTAQGISSMVQGGATIYSKAGTKKPEEDVWAAKEDQ